VFLDESRGILQQLEHATSLARKAACAEAGQITIGFMPGTEGRIFARIVPILLRNYSEIQIVLRTLSSPEQAEALRKREINVGFLRGPVIGDEIASEVFIREKLLAVLPAVHALAQMERIPVPTLAALPLIQTARVVAPATHDAVHAIAARAGVEFQTLFETDNVLTTMNAVASGLGFSLMPEYAQEIIPKTVAVRPLDLDPEPELELLVAYRKDDRLPALAFFLSLLRDFHKAPRGVVDTPPEVHKSGAAKPKATGRSKKKKVTAAS
jgi:LysR family hca operon transcriptional activator